MVVANNFLQWIRAEVCLYRLQVLYFQFYSLLVGFSSRFLLCWGCPLSLSRPLLLGTCNTHSPPDSRLL